MNYTELHKYSIEQPEQFWREQAEQLSWSVFPTSILKKHGENHFKWFEDGRLNICYLSLDYHIEQGRGEQAALIYDCPHSGVSIKYSYNRLRDKVARVAGALQQSGVQKGDRVIIYMPMIPEAIISMLACARIGAIHSVVFGGFAAHELALRIEDAEPKVLLTASHGIEFDRIIPYKALVDDAVKESAWKPSLCVMYQRSEYKADLDSPFYREWNQWLENAPQADCVPVEATHPLYILYTSGTTGKPKGIIRDSGGYAVALYFTMKNIYNAEAGDVFWAASDVGWVVGHSYIVYGPLLKGCTTVLFEGKPIRTPDAGAFWRVISDYSVKIMFTAPTAIRAIKKEDPDGKFVRYYNPAPLKQLFLAGERCDTDTLQWITNMLQKPVTDHWWQTESGWPMLGILTGTAPLPVKPGSAGVPVPGYDIRVLKEDGSPCAPGEEGTIYIKLPLPPGTLTGLWRNEARYHNAYFAQLPGYYLTGDGGYCDEDGYFYIMGRIDDVINVAGHRLSTGEMEEIISGHGAIAECAVIGINDNLRGQRPVGLVVLKDGISIYEGLLEKELIALIREKIGAVAYFKTAAVVKRLPKTRSGKILRKTLRNLADGTPFSIPSTIDDPAILDEIKTIMKNRQIGNAFVDNQ